MTEPYIVKDEHRFEDERGVFTRIALPDYPIAEENYSLSKKAGTIRGLHWQEPQQAKFVRVLQGAILDACVRLADGKVFTFEMSAGQGEALYVPTGYAHGFCTLDPFTLVSYKVSEKFAAGGQYGIDPFDPALAIAWPVSRESATLSAKDAAAPMWRERVRTFPLTSRNEAVG